MFMSGWNGQFNARLQRLEKKAAEGGGSSGGLVEIKNVEPFKVPDLVNGGTRLFDPVNDSLYLVTEAHGSYKELARPFFVSNETPPGFVYIADDRGTFWYITAMWGQEEVYEKAAVENVPHFCVAPSSIYRFMCDGVNGFIVKPENIVYKYTANK